MKAGATLVDTRDGDLRSRDGRIPGSVHIPLSVLEWRVDPTSGHQSAALAGREERLVLICTRGIPRVSPPRGYTTWGSRTPPTSSAALSPGQRRAFRSNARGLAVA
jgi:hypothetical protein